MSLIRSLAVSVVMSLSCGLAAAQDHPPDDGTGSSTIKIAAPRTSRALIVCGMMGDAEHRKLYAETVERLYMGLTTHHGFAPANVALYWSDEVPAGAGPALQSARLLTSARDTAGSSADPGDKPDGNTAPASRAVLIAAVAELEQAIQPDDALWVFVLGHSHYDGRYSWLNIPGPDIQHLEFGKLFVNVRCREQVFFMTGAVSGYYHKSLAAAGRIVISATEPDLEVNETLFPIHLSKTLSEPPPFRDLDVDEDGRLTLLDAYLYTCQKVAEEYAAGMLLATEHAQLDDSGDGRGTEVQAGYLTEELGGLLRANRAKPILKTGDGALARRILLDYPPSPPSPDDAPHP